jgi:hypothetical protein
MIKRITSNRGGIIRTILIVVAILLVLSYFGINLRSVVNSPTGQSNFDYAKEVLSGIWSVIKGPVLMIWNIVWNDIVLPIIRIATKQTPTT